MPLVPVPFGLQTYQDRSLPVAAQELRNLYAAQKPEAAKARVVLQSTPGLKQWAIVGAGPIRALRRYTSQVLFVVSGEELYRVDPLGNAALAGAMPNGAGIVTSANDQNNAVFVDSNAVYYATPTSFGTVSAPFTIGDVTYQDGYLLALEQGSQNWYVNDLLSFAPPVWSSTEFIAANAVNDNLLALTSANRNVWAFGEYSTQVYYNSGRASFPFDLISNGVLNIGILGRDLKTSIEDTVLWVGDDFRVYLARGLSPRRVSTDVIENEIETATSPKDGVAMAYKQFGHTFYVVSFFDKTLVYDVTTGLWHTRRSTGYTGSRASWRAQGVANFAGKRLVGSVDSAQLFELDLNTHSDDGDESIRVLTSAVIHDSTRELTMHRFIVDVESGVGLSTGQGSDPQIMLQFSDDGGRTWSNEQWRSLGLQGKYKHRVYWDRLGKFRNRIMRAHISDAVNVTAISAFAEIERGEE